MRNNYLDEEDELDEDLMEYLSSFLTSSDANGTAACKSIHTAYVGRCISVFLMAEMDIVTVSSFIRV